MSSKNIQRIAFILVLLFIISLRFFLLAAYPFGFGHPDTGQYTETLVRFFKEGVFAPHPIRVMGTYALFLLGVIKGIGATTFSIVFVQHVLGIVTAILAGGIVLKLTRSKWFAIATTLLVGILPRQYLYEHIVLADTQYVLLTLLYIYVSILFLEKGKSVWAFCLGILVTGLMLCRGQGIMGIPLCLAWIFYGGWALRIRIYKTVTNIAVFLLPIFVFCSYYKSLNLKYNDYPGLSANGAYNLFFTATANLTDFDKPTFQRSKTFLKECVIATNKNFQGSCNWALTEEICRAPQVSVLTQFGSPENWRLVEIELNGLAKEAIKAHPMAFLYRIVWNIAEFFYGRREMLSSVDLHVLILKWDVKPIQLDPAKAEQIKGMGLVDVFGGIEHGLDRVKPYFASFNSAQYSSSASFFIHAFSYLENCRNFLAGTLLLLILFLFFEVKQRAVGLLLAAFVLMYGIITAAPVNSLYERYYLPIEPLQIISWFLLFSALKEISKTERKKYFIGVLLLWFVAWGFWKFMKLLPFSWFPVIDAPLIGMDPFKQEMMSRFVFAAFFATVLVCGAAVYYFRLFKRNEKA